MSPAQRVTGPATSPAPKTASTATAKESTRPRRRQLTWTYRVVYERADWVHPRSRYYTRRHDAARFANRLASNPTNDGKHSPIVSISIDRREVVTSWEVYKVWESQT